MLPTAVPLGVLLGLLLDALEHVAGAPHHRMCSIANAILLWMAVITLMTLLSAIAMAIFHPETLVSVIAAHFKLALAAIVTYFTMILSHKIESNYTC